jgi:hypothetical protein
MKIHHEGTKETQELERWSNGKEGDRIQKAGDRRIRAGIPE